MCLFWVVLFCPSLLERIQCLFSSAGNYPLPFLWIVVLSLSLDSHLLPLFLDSLPLNLLPNIFFCLFLNSYHLPFLTSFVIITFIPFMCFLNTSFASFPGLDCCLFSLILLPAYDLLLDCHPLPNICLPILTFFLDSQPTPLTQYCHMISHPLPLLLDSHPLPLLLLMESHPSYFSSG